ncbi:MAG: dephospho-CoA kinase, partial [Clostridia bacterium]|nr:dephospho-CoA kinase [Clostridia bacterium]
MTQNKKIIAVTGGIGSGKSTACRILSDLSYPVFSCDEVYCELLENKDFIKKLEDGLGKVTGEDGLLDRKALSAKVFSDKEVKKTLESISHPAIMEQLLAKAKLAQSDLVFCEVPLLFENGYEDLFDDVIVIMRPLKERIEAVEKRSGLSEKEVLNRIASQYDYSKVEEKSYKIVYNNGNIDSLH